MFVLVVSTLGCAGTSVKVLPKTPKCTSWVFPPIRATEEGGKITAERSVATGAYDTGLGLFVGVVVGVLVGCTWTCGLGCVCVCV